MGILITLSRFLPLAWLLVAVGLGIIEALTVDLFAIGAFITILPASFGLPFPVQLLIFIAVSLVTLVLTRPTAKKFLKVKKTNTNADQIIGMVGVVISPIDNITGRGRVMVNGLDWAARSDDGVPIDENEKVLIKSIEGVKVIVEKIG